ncbi:MAG TPA: DUF4199 domain-containing protein [Flavobacteriales bacterium]|nr:DUF4199 domain-containing protein [Flavobacteriales bacterium]
MKSTVLKYGIISGAIMLGVFTITMAASKMMADPPDFTTQEVLGYASMIIATSVAYFGIKHYRDHDNEGSLSFGQGLKIGLLIVLFPAVLFGVGDVVYITFIDPDWMDNYYAQYLADMKADMLADMKETLPAVYDSIVPRGTTVGGTGSQTWDYSDLPLDVKEAIAKFETKAEEMQAQKEMFASPLFTFFIMFTTVFVIGLIVSIISSLVLKKG